MGNDMQTDPLSDFLITAFMRAAKDETGS